MRGNYRLFYNEELNVPLRCVADSTFYRFLASDVCNALEINPSKLGNLLPDKWERGIFPVYMEGEVVDCICIPMESVYTLCAKSTLNTANIFKRWFTEEVIPGLSRSSVLCQLDRLTLHVRCLSDAIERIENKLG